MTKNGLVLWSLLLASPFVLCSCATVGIEKPKYEVVEKEGKFEVRQYQPQIVAETTVESDFDEAGNVAFRRLFNYISGENRKKESIKMTAPVNQQKAEGKYSVSFVMPSKYTMETLPEPIDANVKVQAIPARKMAAVRYSGSWSRKRYELHKAMLEDFVKQRGLQIIGEDIFARYDPPFQLWFLRRNEVLFPVK